MKTAKKTTKRKRKAAVPVRDEHGLNIRERKFADHVLAGMPAGRAYEKAGYTARGAAADTGASISLRNPKMAAYIKGERRKAAEANQLERWELVGYLCRVLKTPVGSVDEMHELAQEVVRDEIADEVTRSRIKMIDKMAAAKQLAQMLGWNEPEQHKVKFEVVIGGLQDDD